MGLQQGRDGGAGCTSPLGRVLHSRPAHPDHTNTEEVPQAHTEAHVFSVGWAHGCVWVTHFLRLRVGQGCQPSGHLAQATG